MCIVALAWQSIDEFPLLLLSNRDEFYHRPTKQLHYWQDDQLYAGQDLQPGGTWMGGAASLAVPACACDLVASLYLPDSFSARRLDIEGAGEHHEVALHPGESRRIVLPTSVDRSEVRLSVSEVTVPKEEIAGSSDVRRLGVLWTGLSFECAAPEMAQ